jgi:lipase maturation factor 1
MEIERPLVLYDGDCGFCKRWVDRWRVQAGAEVDFAPYQEASGRFPELAAAKAPESVRFVEPGGRVSRGAEAIYRMLAHAPGKAWLLWTYTRVPGAALAAESAYRFVARHRDLGSVVTTLLWGRDLTPATFFLTRWLFLRLLGLVFLIAFVSLWAQIDGLIGSRGILPASAFLERVGQNLGGQRYLLLPSLCWISSSDAFLHALCGAGTVLSLFLIAGVAQGPAIILLWAAYLSLVSVGQAFLSFQWDVLLLETSLFSLFLAPWRLLPSFRGGEPPSQLGLWLLRWLLFKLMFLSGITKLLSGDTSWLELTALPVHYETQPLPTWIGWHAYHLPPWFHRFSLVAMFVIELVVPFFIFAPRRLRHLACALLALLQVVIALTGNYTFFNLLTLSLCVLLLDDRVFRRFLPPSGSARRLTAWLDERHPPRRAGAFRLAATFLAFSLAFASVLTFLGEMVRTHRGASRLPRAPVVPAPATWLLESCDRWLLRWGEPLILDPVRPFGSINGYGLFRVLTTERPEIAVEGSNDGQVWLEYEFPWKPGALDRRPGFVAPHQPRLDWQMWFAALNPRGNLHWLQGLGRGILEGTPEVLALLGKSPFPEGPPRQVRLLYYKYRFSTPEARRQTGEWWSRELEGQLTAPMSLPREK